MKTTDAASALLLLSLLLPWFLNAQEDNTKNPTLSQHYEMDSLLSLPQSTVTSFSIGLGTSSVGPLIHTDFYYSMNNLLIQGRYIYSKETDLFLRRETQTAWEIGALVGFYSKTTRFAASISAGINLSGGLQRGRFLRRYNGWFQNYNIYEYHSYRVIGIPVEAQLIWTPDSSFGFGVCCFINRTSKLSVNGVSFDFRVFL